MKQKTLSFVSCTKTASNRLGNLNWKASSSITKISRQIIQFEVVHGKADKQNIANSMFQVAKQLIRWPSKSSTE